MLLDHHRIVLLYAQDNLRRVQAFHDEAIVFHKTLDYLKAYSAPGQSYSVLPPRDRIHVVYEKISHVVEVIRDDLRWLEEITLNDLTFLAEAHLHPRDRDDRSSQRIVVAHLPETAWSRRLARAIRNIAARHLLETLPPSAMRDWCFTTAQLARETVRDHLRAHPAATVDGGFDPESGADLRAVEGLTVLSDALVALAHAPTEVDTRLVASRLAALCVREAASAIRFGAWDSPSCTFLDRVLCYPRGHSPPTDCLRRLCLDAFNARVRRRAMAATAFSLKMRAAQAGDFDAMDLAGEPALPHPIDHWFFRYSRFATREIEAATRALRNVESGLGERLDVLPPGVGRPPGLFPGKGEERVLRFLDELVLRYRDTALRFANDFLFQASSRVEGFELETTAALVHEYAPDLVAARRWVGGPNVALINVPFWYTEVPRYLVNLAHELAHLVLQKRAQGYEGTLRAPLDTLLSDWIAATGAALDHGPPGHFPHQRIESIIEVLADIVAVFVAGPYYPLSFFLTACGHLSADPGIAPEEHANAVIRTSAMLATLDSIREASGCRSTDCVGFDSAAVTSLQAIRAEYYEEIDRRIRGLRDAHDRDLLSLKRNYLQVLEDIFTFHARRVSAVVARALVETERKDRCVLPFFLPRKLAEVPEWIRELARRHEGLVAHVPTLAAGLTPHSEGEWFYTSPGWIVTSERLVDNCDRLAVTQLVPHLLWDTVWRHVDAVKQQVALPGERSPQEALFARVEEKKMLDRIAASHSSRKGGLKSLRIAASWRAAYYEALEATTDGHTSSFFFFGRLQKIFPLRAPRGDRRPKGYFAFSCLGFRDFLFLEQITGALCNDAHDPCPWRGPIDSEDRLGPQAKAEVKLRHYVVPRVYYEVHPTDLPGDSREEGVKGRLMILVQARIKRAPNGELLVSEEDALVQLAGLAREGLVIWKAFVAKGWEELVVFFYGGGNAARTLQAFCDTYRRNPTALTEVLAETYTSILLCEDDHVLGGKVVEDLRAPAAVSSAAATVAASDGMSAVELVTIGRYRRYSKTSESQDLGERGLAGLCSGAPQTSAVRLIVASELAGAADVKVTWEVAGSCTDEVFLREFPVLLDYVVSRLGLHSISTHLVLRSEK